MWRILPSNDSKESPEKRDNTEKSNLRGSESNEEFSDKIDGLISPLIRSISPFSLLSEKNSACFYTTGPTVFSNWAETCTNESSGFVITIDNIPHSFCLSETILFETIDQISQEIMVGKTIYLIKTGQNYSFYKINDSGHVLYRKILYYKIPVKL